MRWRVVPLLVCLAGCALPDPRGEAGAPTLEAAVARLPAEVAGFSRGDTTWHERDRPGQGAAVDFAGPARAAVATVSVYDRGRFPLPTDDGTVAAEFALAVDEVLAAAGARTRQVMTERARSDIAVPDGAPMRCARLGGTYGRQEVTTLVCLGPAAGRFLKVQVTSPARQVRPVDPVPFVVGVAQAARGG
jgi:hypothetical protein